MQQSIYQELLNHVIDIVVDTDMQEFDDLQHEAFNMDYYIVGYYQAEQWLKSHDVSAWDAISAVIEWEENVLGEVSLKSEDINAERIVNLYTYVLGEELLTEFDLEQSQDELLADMREQLEHN